MAEIRSSVKVVRLDLLDRDPRQPRKDFDEKKIEELAQSILVRGLLQKPIVRPNPEIEGRFKIVAGERRCRALQLIGFEEHEVNVLEGLTDEDAFILSAVENFNRLDLNPIEEAETIQRLQNEERLNMREIGDLLGRTELTLRNKLRLLTLPDEIKQMVRENKLPQNSALNLIQFKGPKAEMIRLARQIVLGDNPLVLHTTKARDSAHGEQSMLGRLPTDAEGLMRKVLEIRWRSKSMIMTIRAFLGCHEQEREMVLRQLPASARQALDEYFSQLAVACDDFCESLSKVKPSQTDQSQNSEGVRPRPRRKRRERVEISSESSNSGADEPKVDTVSGADGSSKSKPAKNDDNDLNNKMPRGQSNNTSFDLSYAVVRTIFPRSSGTILTVNLSKGNLFRVLGERGFSVDQESLDTVVIRSFRDFDQCWSGMHSTNGLGEAQKGMGHLAANIRSLSSNIRLFKDLTAHMFKVDKSEDPVAL